MIYFKMLNLSLVQKITLMIKV